MATFEDVRRLGLPLPEVTEGTFYGTAALKVRGNMKWAVAEGHRGDNPAGDAIGAALPRNSGRVEHHEALPYANVAAALEKVQASDAAPTTKLCIRFLVLTACRSGQVRHARWDEIDLEAAV